MIVTEIATASWKQSLQPVPFSLIMWWATLDYINQFVCTHTRECVWLCVCAKIVLQLVILEKAFTFYCVESAVWNITNLPCQHKWIVVFGVDFFYYFIASCSIYIPRLVLSFQCRCWCFTTVCFRSVISYSNLLLNTMKQSTISQNPCWCHLTITSLLTAVPLAMFTSHCTLSWGN